MILLPRGNAVKENVDPRRINLPDALTKLKEGSFTGYLRFDAEVETGIIIFEEGKLLSALFDAGNERVVNYDALKRIFERSLEGCVRLHIYRLSPELALCVYALLHGEMLYQGQDLKLIDIKGLLGRVKADRLNGCLRIYTEERIALIFYDEGQALGFFHDGSTRIETTADASMSVARLPGAKVDVLITPPFAELNLTDLLGAADLPMLWEQLRQKARTRQQEVAREEERQRGDRRRQRLQQLKEYLRGTAERHVGRIGVALVDKELDKLGGEGIDPALLEGFLGRLGRAARMVAGAGAVKTMVSEMEKGARAYFD